MPCRIRRRLGDVIDALDADITPQAEPTPVVLGPLITWPAPDEVEMYLDGRMGLREAGTWPLFSPTGVLLRERDKRPRGMLDELPLLEPGREADLPYRAHGAPDAEVHAASLRGAMITLPGSPVASLLAWRHGSAPWTLGGDPTQQVEGSG